VAADTKASGSRRFLGMTITPVTARRLANFRANRRGYWALWAFLALFFFSLFAEFIANDKPLIVHYDGGIYLPIFNAYPETTFGGDFETEADYTDPFVVELIDEKGWLLMPLIPFSYDTPVMDLPTPAPSPPTVQNWLGTDDQARDVSARLIYGFRISVLFGVTLTVFASIIGIIAGAIQGYYGGWVDLSFQRFIEIWEGMPFLFVLLIVASLFVPGFWTLLFIMLLFSWTNLVGVVRAEFLRARNFDYVRAARALGVRNRIIMFRHVLPNAMVATITFLPFTLVGGLTALTGLDFLGLGLPPGSPSLGELLKQAKENFTAEWLTFAAFFSIMVMLMLVVFVGEAVRDAFDPRKQISGDAG
jgi:microcin C transport system permease protein